MNGDRHRARSARIAALHPADFCGRAQGLDEDAFERKLYVVRKRTENADRGNPDIEDKEFFYIPSLSCRTIVYKGLLLAPQIANFYGELSDPM